MAKELNSLSEGQTGRRRGPGGCRGSSPANRGQAELLVPLPSAVSPWGCWCRSRAPAGRASPSPAGKRRGWAPLTGKVMFPWEKQKNACMHLKLVVILAWCRAVSETPRPQQHPGARRSCSPVLGGCFGGTGVGAATRALCRASLPCCVAGRRLSRGNKN